MKPIRRVSDVEQMIASIKRLDSQPDLQCDLELALWLGVLKSIADCNTIDNAYLLARFALNSLQIDIPRPYEDVVQMFNPIKSG